MMLIRLPDELFNRVPEISENLGKSIGDYLTELLEQAVRAHELGCSLKDAVDLYERTVKERKTPEESELVEAPSVAEVFERMLAPRLRPELSECEESKMLSRFISQLSKKPSTPR
jgi:predicted DNA-binding protein